MGATRAARAEPGIARVRERSLTRGERVRLGWWRAKAPSRGGKRGGWRCQAAFIVYYEWRVVKALVTPHSVTQSGRHPTAARGISSADGTC